MGSSIGGFADPFSRYARGVPASPSEAAKPRKAAPDAAPAARPPLQVDFAEALQALERASAHVQNARLSYQQADSLRPSPSPKNAPGQSPAGSGSTTAPVRRGLDLRG